MAFGSVFRSLCRAYATEGALNFTGPWPRLVVHGYHVRIVRNGVVRVPEKEQGLNTGCTERISGPSGPRREILGTKSVCKRLGFTKALALAYSVT